MNSSNRPYLFRPEEMLCTRIADSDWVARSMSILESDYNRSAETHLVALNLKGFEDTPIYLKDESTHITGSLKHRLARSLFIYSICNGFIGPRTTVVEASSGSTAVSEAYFARLLGLNYIAVMPRSTSKAKVAEIERFGGKCHFVDSAASVYAEAAKLATKADGYYIDQFTNAERATDWRSNNIAQSIFDQMSKESMPVPAWAVMSPGTGGTSAAIGRYIKYKGMPTKLCVPDPEISVFHDSWSKKDANVVSTDSSRIEGIGRPRVEPSFVPSVIDAMVKVPDEASIAAMQILCELLGRKVGPSSGTNLFGVLCVIAQMRREGQTGPVVSLICDSGQRYLDTYYNPDWLASKGFDPREWRSNIESFISAPHAATSLRLDRSML